MAILNEGLQMLPGYPHKLRSLGNKQNYSYSLTGIFFKQSSINRFSIYPSKVLPTNHPAKLLIMMYWPRY